MSVRADSEQVASIAGALGVAPEVVERHHAVHPDGAVHAWLPGRGRAHLLAGTDGGFLVVDSAVSLPELRQRYAAGERSEMTQVLAAVHTDAAAGVRDLVLSVTNQPSEPLDRAVTEADLAAAKGNRPFEETTWQEIKARLEGDAPGALLVVGFDRAEGPGHWFLGWNENGTAIALDPLRRTERLPFPPPYATDAVRWFADGPPLRPFGITEPDPLRLAARLLGLDEATARRHSHAYADGAVHVWSPERGGLQAIAGADGTALVEESRFPAAVMRAMWERGSRAASASRLRTAAVSVADAVDALRGRTPEPRDRVGRADLERLVGRQLQETTPAGIEAALGEPGTYAVVGIDRTQGPGHWLLAVHGSEGLFALEPSTRARTPWPPEQVDASRWWATIGPAPAPPPAPEEESVSEATAHGVRIWAKAPTRLKNITDHLVKRWSQEPAERVTSGRGLFYAFFWTVLRDDGQGGLRVAGWDLETEQPAWDLVPTLEVMRDQAKAVNFAKVDRAACTFLQRFHVEPGALEAPQVHLVRREPADRDDSGWHVTLTPEGTATEVMTGKELYQRRPKLTAYLGFPTGWRGLDGNGRMLALWNPAGEQVWDAAAYDAAQAATKAAASAQATTQATGQSTAPPTQQGAAAAPRPEPRPAPQRPLDAARAALAAGEPDPAALEAAGLALFLAFRRGDAMIGILPPGADAVLVRTLTAAGTPRAYVALGDWLRRPDVGRADPTAALRAYGWADLLGDPDGTYLWLAVSYFGDAPRAEDRVARLEELIAAGDPDGRWHRLRGWMRFKGYGYPRDVAASVRDHEQAAALGDADSMFELHVLLAGDQGVPADPARSQLMLEQAAERDQPRALYNLAAQYATGRAGTLDPARAVGLYERAAELGNAQAAFTAGVMHATGEGVAVGPDRARELLHLASSLGHPVEDVIASLGSPLQEQLSALLAGDEPAPAATTVAVPGGYAEARAIELFCRVYFPGRQDVPFDELRVTPLDDGAGVRVVHAVRGGGSLYVAPDGSMLAAGSATAPHLALQRFLDGERTVIR